MKKPGSSVAPGLLFGGLAAGCERFASGILHDNVVPATAVARNYGTVRQRELDKVDGAGQAVRTDYFFLAYHSVTVALSDQILQPVKRAARNKRGVATLTFGTLFNTLAVHDLLLRFGRLLGHFFVQQDVAVRHVPQNISTGAASCDKLANRAAGKVQVEPGSACTTLGVDARKADDKLGRGEGCFCHDVLRVLDKLFSVTCADRAPFKHDELAVVDDIAVLEGEKFVVKHKAPVLVSLLIGYPTDHD